MAAVTWPAPAAAPEPEPGGPAGPGPADIRRQYEAEVQRIEADELTHPAAKQVLLAKAFSRADSALRALEAEADRADTLAYAAAHSDELFESESVGESGQRDVLLGRDAADRASRIESAEDAAAQLRRASKRRDAALWNALAAEVCRRSASDSEYASLAERVIEASPAKQRVAKLRAKDAASIAQSRGRYWLAPPAQLGDLDRHQVHDLAQRDPAEAARRADRRDAGAWDRMRKFKPMSV